MSAALSISRDYLINGHGLAIVFMAITA